MGPELVPAVMPFAGDQRVSIERARAQIMETGSFSGPAAGRSLYAWNGIVCGHRGHQCSASALGTVIQPSFSCPPVPLSFLPAENV